MKMNITELKKLTTKKRKDLPDSAFCDPENRRYPANDAAHVRNGLARIAQNKNDPKYKSILACLKKRAKKFGIKVKEETEQYEDTDFALIKDGEKLLQFRKYNILQPDMLLDCLKTVDYMVELSDEEWYNARKTLFTHAYVYVNALGARNDSERAKAHFKISDEEWNKLSDKEKQAYIDKLPPRGSYKK